jgi:hypothetical protein
MARGTAETTDQAMLENSLPEPMSVGVYSSDVVAN